MRYHLPVATAAVTLCSVLSIMVVHAEQYPFRQEPFTDVSKTHANFDAVEYLRTNNIIKGYQDGTFRSGRKITRAEFTALLTNPYFLSGRSNNCLQEHFPLDKPHARVFLKDVARNSWYAQDVCEAIVHDIVNGYPDGTFKANYPVNFAEAAKIVMNVFGIDVRRDSLDANTPWYAPYVRRLAEIKAIPTSIRRFDQQITRGEMAEILYRVKVGNTTKASMTYENLR